MMDGIQDQQQHQPWANPNSTSSSLQSQEMHHQQDEATTNDESFLTQPYSTLDEPIRETIMRDVRSVVSKIKVVLLPLKKSVSFSIIENRPKTVSYLTHGVIFRVFRKESIGICICINRRTSRS